MEIVSNFLLWVTQRKFDSNDPLTKRSCYKQGGLKLTIMEKIDADVSIRCSTLTVKVVEIMASFEPRTGQILRLHNLEFRGQKNLSQALVMVRPVDSKIFLREILLVLSKKNPVASSP